MDTVTSADGTRLAYDRVGQGPALILVQGLFEQRALDTETAKLAALPLLAQHFTVYHYDRRGRGDSGDTPPYALAREIEDLDALIGAAGGSAYVFGISSGAAMALEAALALGQRVQKLALYEPPYNDDPQARQSWRQYRHDLAAILAKGQRGQAVERVMQMFGVPDDHLAAMHDYPLWPAWEALAPSVAYDAAALGEEAAVPVQRAAALTMPVLIMDGEASYPFMHVSALALAQAIPHAQHRTLAGQTHEVAAEVLGPVLVEFFNG